MTIQVKYKVVDTKARPALKYVSFSRWALVLDGLLKSLACDLVTTNLHL